MITTAIISTINTIAVFLSIKSHPTFMSQNFSIYFSIFKNLELKATIMVLTDINMAPAAGVNIIPYAKRMPAAIGIAKTLYPVPHSRFSIILRYVDFASLTT